MQQLKQSVDDDHAHPRALSRLSDESVLVNIDTTAPEKHRLKSVILYRFYFLTRTDSLSSSLRAMQQLKDPEGEHHTDPRALSRLSDESVLVNIDTFQPVLYRLYRSFLHRLFHALTQSSSLRATQQLQEMKAVPDLSGRALSHLSE